MSIDITIQIYPAAGGGIQVVQTPRGDMPIVIPWLNYEHVREILVQQQDYIKFVLRDGSEVETTMPWLIKKTVVAEGNA